MKILEDLRRLEQAAPPLVKRYGPSPGGTRYQFAAPDDNAALIVYGKALADVTEAALAALPVLLRVVEAAREATSLNSLCAELLVKLHGVDPTIEDEVALNGLHAEEEAAWVELRAALDALEADCDH